MYDYWRQLKSEKLVPSTVSFNTMLHGCAKAKQWKQALRLLGEMEKRGVEKDFVTIGTILDSFRGSGQWEYALEIFEETDIKHRTSFVYYSMIDCLKDAGELKKGIVDQ